MANETRERKKRKSENADDHQAKRPRDVSPGFQNYAETSSAREAVAGKIERIFVRNFMCHEAMEIKLNPNVNFIVGRNGSGKSAILTALVVGLGARANITNRGTSIKEFIKKGKNSAIIEVTIINEGPMAYKPKTYGNRITVIRNISSSPSYKIKNSRGEIVSTRREELDRVISAMNIQVDNPVSVLNQDVSRTFLVTAGPKDKYELFMKATQLDKIGDNYKQAKKSSEDTKERLNVAKKNLKDAGREVHRLEENLRMLKSIDETRLEYDSLQKELHWAIAIGEEKNLHRIEASLKEYEDNMNAYRVAIATRETKEIEINTKIKELNAQIEAAQVEAANSTDKAKEAKKQYLEGREKHFNKVKEWKSTQNGVKRLEDDIAILRKEIKRLEGGSSKAESDRCQIKEQLTKKEQELVEVEAMLRTKETDQRHLETDKSHILVTENEARMEIERSEAKMRDKERQLNGLKRQPDNAVAVFGPNMPRLLKRIQEENAKGRFKQKPRGPLGAYIKMKDITWAPAVESYLGFGGLSSFCVDNGQDARILSGIIKEVYRNESAPQIIASKFYHRVHDVSRHATSAPGYFNLLEAMEISDPVVANSLIDQREVECVLLIPTSQEACDMMSDARRVPRNCKRAFTLQGDTFYPDPNYRSYGGRVGQKARFLQVSTTDAIHMLEEEFVTAEEERLEAAKRHANIRDKYRRTNSDLEKVMEQVTKLRTLQHKLKTTIESLRDQYEFNETNSTEVFVAELKDLQEKLQQDRIAEKRLSEEEGELQKNVNILEAEVKRYRDLMSCLDARLSPIKIEIRNLNNEKQMLSLNTQHSSRKLQEFKQVVQQLTAELETQQRITDKVLTDAANYGDRINTQRSVNEIKRLAQDLKANIESIEEKLGSKEAVEKELEKKREKYDEITNFASNVEKTNDKHLIRLENRKQLFRDMKHQIGIKVQHSFKSVLAVRKYKGSMHIDHNNRSLDLEVSPATDANRATSDARSLSGGERSYSTVAFILALWDCTGLPFYFLDEFDVFMDKVNRRVIMDILLDHAKSHPQNQFAFLTPLDTSNIFAEDYVTIHRLAPPERGGN